MRRLRASIRALAAPPAGRSFSRTSSTRCAWRRSGRRSRRRSSSSSTATSPPTPPRSWPAGSSARATTGPGGRRSRPRSTGCARCRRTSRWSSRSGRSTRSSAPTRSGSGPERFHDLAYESALRGRPRHARRDPRVRGGPGRRAPPAGRGPGELRAAWRAPDRPQVYAQLTGYVPRPRRRTGRRALRPVRRALARGIHLRPSWWLDAAANGAWRLHSVQEKGELVAAWPTVPRETGSAGSRGARLTPFLGPLFAPDDDPPAAARSRSAASTSWSSARAVRAPRGPLQPGLRLLGAALLARVHADDALHLAPDRPLRPRGRARRHQGERPRRHPQGRAQGVEVGEGTLAEFLAVQAKTAEQKGFGSGQGNPALERIDAAAAARGARTILVARGEDGAVTRAPTSSTTTGSRTTWPAGATRRCGRAAELARRLGRDPDGGGARPRLRLRGLDDPGRREVLPRLRRRADALLGGARDALAGAAGVRPVKRAARRLTRR